MRGAESGWGGGIQTQSFQWPQDTSPSQHRCVTLCIEYRQPGRLTQALVSRLTYIAMIHWLIDWLTDWPQDWSQFQLPTPWNLGYHLAMGPIMSYLVTINSQMWSRGLTRNNWLSYHSGNSQGLEVISKEPGAKDSSLYGWGRFPYYAGPKEW